MTYSSRDILGNTVAGRERNFFTRIKKKKASSQKPQSPRKRPSKKLIIICSVAFGIVAVGLVVLIIFLTTNSRNSAEAELDETEYTWNLNYDEPDLNEIRSKAENMQIDSAESAEEFDYYTNDLAGMLGDDADEILDGIYQRRINEVTNPDARFIIEISYALFLLEDNIDSDKALNILRGIREGKLTLAQKEKFYGAYRYYYEKIGDQAQEEKYDELLGKVMEELYPSANVETETSNENEN